MTIAFVLVALLVGVAGVAGYVGLGQVDGEAHLIAEDGMKMGRAAELIVAVEQQQSAVRAAELGEVGAQSEFECASDAFETQLQNLESTHLSEEQESRLAALESAHADYDDLGAVYFEAKQAGNDDVAAQKAEAMGLILPTMEEHAHALEESASTDLEEQVASADSVTMWTRIALLGITIGAFAAAIGVGLFLSRRITSSVTKVADAAVAMSEGDFDDDLDDHTANDEIGQMVDAVNEMRANLRGVFGELNDVSQNLKSGLLAQDVETGYHGAYGEVVENLADGTDTLSASFDQIRRASDVLSEGRLDEDIDTSPPGEYGQVLGDLQGGIVRMSDSLGAVQDIATEVAGSSEEIASSTEESSRRAIRSQRPSRRYRTAPRTRAKSSSRWPRR